MAGMKERLPQLREEFIESHKWLLEHRGLDNPAYWSEYMSDHRLLAVAAYALDHDVEGFKEHLRKGVDFQIKRLLHRQNTLDYGCYQDFFDALALGEPVLIKKIVELTAHVDVSARGIPANIPYIFYALRLFILGTGAGKEDMVKMQEACQGKHKSFVGYALCFQAIYDQDVAKFTEGFEQMMKGHKNLISGYHLFANTEDEVIALWPLGIVNLARLKGLDVTVDHPLVPRDLLTPHLGEL